MNNLTLPEINLVGIKCRTSNLAEMNIATAQIGQMVGKYFSEKISDKISNKKVPEKIYCVYTEYESDFTGEYTFFIGQEVESFDDIASELYTIVIPSQNYTKFTTEPGVMPDVCINMWKKIWSSTPHELGGERAYIADFEVYDERAINPKNAVLDIYIGVNT